MDKVGNWRHEFKYLCSKNELEVLNAKLKTVMKLDKNTQESGKYRIRSIYFDDLYNSKYYENETGISPREKWRIRTYNEQIDTISLECKRKECDKIMKTSCKLTYEQYKNIIGGNYEKMISKDNKLLNRFLILCRTKHLRPKVIVGYERKPFVCKEGNVRVTFDFNLFSSPDIECFFETIIRKRPILPTGMHMLEIKYDEFLPDYLYRSMQTENMRRTTFSKYCCCRKYSL